MSATQPAGTGHHSYSYGYDGAGNVTSVTKDGSTTSYGYGANELCWSVAGTQASSACTPTPTGATTYSYDETVNPATTRLNLVSSTAGLALSYNDKNQTTSMTNLTGGSASGTIGYAGPNQFERTTYGSTTFTNNVLGVGVEKTGTSSTYYTRDNAGTLVSEKLPSGSRYYYAFDRLGSVAALIDTNGNAPETFSYDPYGVTSTSGTAIANPWRYASAYQDATGFYKMGLRYYRPELMRWSQADAIEGPAAPVESDRYAYAGDDPVNLVDRSGLVTDLGGEMAEPPGDIMGEPAGSGEPYGGGAVPRGGTVSAPRVYGATIYDTLRTRVVTAARAVDVRLHYAEHAEVLGDAVERIEQAIDIFRH